MQISSFYKLGLLGIAATLIAIAGHGLLPEKHIKIHPGQAEISVYSDQMIGGLSRASWIDEQQLHWRCDIKDSGGPLFCGLHMVLLDGGKRGVDLSSYHTLRVELEANTSDSRLRIFLRNHELDFSEEGNMESAKFLNVLIPITDIGAELSIDLQEFAVAEWWIAEWNVPRKLAFPKFDDIRAIGIDLGVPPVEGVHELKLSKMYFVGDWIAAESWYRAILLAWVFALSMFCLQQFIQLRRRLMREGAKIENVASTNSQLKSATDKYRELSIHDKLTGALNRRGFDQVMEALAGQLKPNEQSALLMLDVDHFKRINDDFGHDVGDVILKRMSEVLRKLIRRDDHLVRWGGEEFLVLCPRLDLNGAASLAEKLRKSVEQSSLHPAKALKVSVSIGFGCFTRNDDFEDVFGSVDAALYAAKSAGRNRVSLATAKQGSGA